MTQQKECVWVTCGGGSMERQRNSRGMGKNDISQKLNGEEKKESIKNIKKQRR